MSEENKKLSEEELEGVSGGLTRKFDTVGEKVVTEPKANEDNEKVNSKRPIFWNGSV